MLDVLGKFFIFQWESAPVHRARHTGRRRERTTPAIIPPELRPSNSPELNLVDCMIWGSVHQRVYQSRVHNVGELKQRLLNGMTAHLTGARGCERRQA